MGIFLAPLGPNPCPYSYNQVFLYPGQECRNFPSETLGLQTRFFNQQRVGAGAAVIGAFYLALLATTAAFASLDTLAGLLMLPTCAWVTVAASLNLSIWRLNRAAKA